MAFVNICIMRWLWYFFGSLFIKRHRLLATLQMKSSQAFSLKCCHAILCFNPSLKRQLLLYWPTNDFAIFRCSKLFLHLPLVGTASFIYLPNNKLKSLVHSSFCNKQTKKKSKLLTAVIAGGARKPWASMLQIPIAKDQHFAYSTVSPCTDMQQTQNAASKVITLPVHNAAQPRVASTSQHWHTVESALLKISAYFSLSQLAVS